MDANDVYGNLRAVYTNTIVIYIVYLEGRPEWSGLNYFSISYYLVVSVRAFFHCVRTSSTYFNMCFCYMEGRITAETRSMTRLAWPNLLTLGVASILHCVRVSYQIDNWKQIRQGSLQCIRTCS